MKPLIAVQPETDLYPPFERELARLEEELTRLRATQRPGNPADARGVADKEDELRRKVSETYRALTPMQKVQVSRFPQRPMTLDYIESCFQDFFELHGDRRHPEDTAIVGGLARLGERAVMVIGHQRGHTGAERSHRNNGMPNPDGLRKAHRLMRMAEQFQMPVVTFIDTPGAFPGAGAEERGMMQAIARSLLHMSGLAAPIVSVVIGEGGSGGALALSVADHLMILKYSFYSVISPEGCASILWRDPEKSETAAQLLRLTADELLEMGIVDQVIDEPLGGAHRFPAETLRNVREAIVEWVDRLSNKPIATLCKERKERIRRFGLGTLSSAPEVQFVEEETGDE